MAELRKHIWFQGKREWRKKRKRDGSGISVLNTAIDEVHTNGHAFVFVFVFVSLSELNWDELRRHGGAAPPFTPKVGGSH